jgi:hypothetical protein
MHTIGHVMQQNTTHILKRKTAQQTVTNSTTQVAITQLLAALGANEVWAFTLKLLLNGKAIADADVSLTGPAGSTLTYGDIAEAAKDAVGAAEINFPLVDDLPTICTIEGVISTGATAGNLQALFAQATANASDVDCEIGSSLELRRIDDTT